MTYRSDTRCTALRLDPWPFSKKPDKGLQSNPASLRRELHTFGKCCARLVELHDATFNVMLAMRGNFIRRRPVQSETEWRCVLPHLSCHVVPPAQLVSKKVSEGIEDNSAERFCCKELDFGTGVVSLHQACGMHLDPLEIDSPCSEVLTHLTGVSRAVHTIDCGSATNPGNTVQAVNCW